MAIISGRRAVRPDGGVYRNMRRLRLARGPAGRRRRTAARAMVAAICVAVAAGVGYAAWRWLGHG